MQDKSKVTLYLPHELHRQLKIKAAVHEEAMSAIAERAIVFYLEHPHLVDEVEEIYGQSHRVYSCPGCSGSYVMREGELTPLSEQSCILCDDELSAERVSAVRSSLAEQAGGTGSGEETLVPC